MKNKLKQWNLLGLAFASLALLALPQTGQAFELKELWPIKGGIAYENGKVARFNNGHEVDIQVIDLPKTEKNRMDGQSKRSGSNDKFPRAGKGKIHDR